MPLCFPGDISFHPLKFSSLYAAYPSYITFLFVFVKWILYKRWILRCIIVKARPNGSNIVGRCCTRWQKTHEKLGVERSGFKIYPQSIENKGAPYWFAKMARNRPTVKIYLAAIALLEMSENENDKVTKRGTAYREIMRRFSDFMTSMGWRLV